MNKIVSCATVRDLLAMEEEGLLSPESQKLVQEHLGQCMDCRLARQDMGLKAGGAELGEGVSPLALPLTFRQRALSFMGKFRLVGIVLLILLALAWYRHNYTQPLVVEWKGDSRQRDEIIAEFHGYWDELRDERFEIQEYDYISPPLAQLLEEGGYHLSLGQGSNRRTLSTEESLTYLEYLDQPLDLTIKVWKYTGALIARTGWLMWERAQYSDADIYIELPVEQSLGMVVIHQEHDGNTVPQLMAAGRDKHAGLLPRGISRPGRWRP